MGAWIEIYVTGTSGTNSSVSLPSWERGLKSSAKITPLFNVIVAPLVGAWIEIVNYLFQKPVRAVAPLVGAWIEIILCIGIFWTETVAPLVGAWIEITIRRPTESISLVAPLVGAWIEIYGITGCAVFCPVAPLVGAWIEIGNRAGWCTGFPSLPSWERGLKCGVTGRADLRGGRSPRGSVD